METLIIAVTNRQKKEVGRLAKDAVDRVVVEGLLDKDGIQKLIENSNEFLAHIIAVIKKFSVSNQFADEEVSSFCVYPEGYRVKEIAEQVVILRQLFPELKGATFNKSIAARPISLNVEGWFAIPRWQTLAPTYGEAVERVFAMIRSKRTFYNNYKNQTGPRCLRQHVKTVMTFQKLGDKQKDYDILVVPCQFGFRHRGRSVRRAREVFLANEFGLGAFAVGIMLLTHPERLVQREQLHINCSGDGFAPNANGIFSSVPLFSFNDGMVEFNAYQLNYADEHNGSASAFLPI